MKYKIPITLECEAIYSIEASNMQEALEQVREKFAIPFPSKLLKAVGDNVLIQGSLDVVNMSIDSSRLYVKTMVENTPREVKWLNK